MYSPSDISLFVQMAIGLLFLLYLYLLRVISLNTKDLQQALALAESSKEKQLPHRKSLNDLSSHCGTVGCDAILRSGLDEYFSSQKIAPDKATTMENVQRTIQRTLDEEVDRLERNLPLLTTLGAISPYIGAIGAMGGVYDSFSVSDKEEHFSRETIEHIFAGASLSLMCGFAVAIQAVIAYNRAIARIEQLRKHYDVFIVDLIGLLQRVA